MDVPAKQIKNIIYLAVGDDLLSSELNRHILQAGYELKQFTKLGDLETALSVESPLAIVLDMVFNIDLIYEKGESAGLQLIRRVKDLVEESSKIFFISDRDNTEFRLESARAGADRYFYKPLVIKKFIQSLNSLLQLQNPNPCRILLIDDEQSLLSMYSLVLRKVGLEVATTTNPLDVLTLLTEFKPDIVVLDFHMPDCPGSDLAKFIRQDDNWALTPIIFLSGDSSLNNQLQAIQYGGDDFLEKSMPIQKIITVLHAWAVRARKNVQLHNDLKYALRENKFQLVTMDQHSIVSSTDTTGRILSANEKFCEISGYSKDELLGQNHRLLKSGLHPKQFYEDMWKTISSGEIWHGTICNRSKSGREYWVDSTIVPFLDERGKPYKYVSARTDITALRQHQERLQLSQDYAGIGMWDWDIKNDYIYWSDQARTLYGYSQDLSSIKFENFTAIVHPEDQKRVTQAVVECLEKGTKYDIEHRVIWPDGSVHWLLQRGDVQRNEQGEPLHMLGIVQDISKRVKAESQLRESEQRFTQAIEGVGDAVWDCNLETGTVKMSAQGFSMLGYAEHELGEKVQEWLQLIHPDDVANTNLMLKRYLKGQSDSLVMEQRVRCKNGSYKWIMARGSEVDRNNEGWVTRIVGINSDINARKKAEEELILAQHEAEDANKAKSQFLSSMSHELRTPMNAIIGFTQLMQMDSQNPLNDVQASNLHEIMKAGDHLLMLINQLLDLARIETGHIELSVSTVKLSQVVNEALQLIIPLAKRQSLEVKIYKNNKPIRIDDLSDSETYVLADFTRLKQTLINLLSNAVKYNSINGEITIACDELNDQVIRISVTDTGKGLSQAEQEQLFTAFNRLGVEQTKIEGTGIGLVISKNIIEKMGGRIGVQSSHGAGSTFWIEIPRDTQAVIKEEKTPVKIIAPPGVRAAEFMKPKKERTVLYIEDNPANLRLVTELLGRLPYINMLAAHEPQLGLDLTREHLPDLVLLDINLPEMDGFEVLRLLREDKATCDIPVIAVSANAMTSDIKKGIEAGFTDYITKPIDVTQMLLAVDDVLAAKS